MSWTERKSGEEVFNTAKTLKMCTVIFIRYECSIKTITEGKREPKRDKGKK